MFGWFVVFIFGVILMCFLVFNVFLVFLGVIFIKRMLLLNSIIFLVIFIVELRKMMDIVFEILYGLDGGNEIIVCC